MVETRHTEEETVPAEGAPETGEVPVGTYSRAISDHSEEEEDEDEDEDDNNGSIFSRIGEAILGEYSSSESDDNDDSRPGEVGVVHNGGSPSLRFWQTLIFIFSLFLVFQFSITMVLLRLVFFSSTLRAQDAVLQSDPLNADYVLGVISRSSLSKALFPLMRLFNIQPGPLLLFILGHLHSPPMVTQLQAPGDLTAESPDIMAESASYGRSQAGALDQPFWREEEGGPVNISAELYHYLTNKARADERAFLKDPQLGLEEPQNAERMAQNAVRAKPVMEFIEGSQNVTIRLSEEEPPDKQERSYKE